MTAMKQTIVRILIIAFGLLCAVVVSLMIFVGDPDHHRELDELAGHFESDPSPQRLRDLLNHPADAAYSYYKMALIGASSVKHPNAFQSVADDLRTDEERESLQRLASRGAGVFEYHPELKPSDFEKAFREQKWLTKVRAEQGPDGSGR